MARSNFLVFTLAISTLASQASASFGFTNPTFTYVQPSSPINLAWNGNSGDVTLRILVYPPDEGQSYLPIAANLSGSTYTWLPGNLAAGSQWTLEGIDESGQIASADQFTVQSSGSNAGSSPALTTSFMQQNPQTTATPTTFITSSATPSSSGTSVPTSTRTSTPEPSPSTHNYIGVWIGIACGLVAVAILVLAFIVIRRRRGKSANPFRSRKPTPRTSPIITELEGKEGISKGYSELEGCETPGSVETSMGKRVELG